MKILPNKNLTSVIAKISDNELYNYALNQNLSIFAINGDDAKILSPFDGRLIMSGSSEILGNYVMIEDKESGRIITLGNLASKKFANYIYDSKNTVEIKAGEELGVANNISFNKDSQNLQNNNKKALIIELYNKKEANKIKSNIAKKIITNNQDIPLFLKRENVRDFLLNFAINQAKTNLAKNNTDIINKKIADLNNEERASIYNSAQEAFPEQINLLEISGQINLDYNKLNSYSSYNNSQNILIIANSSISGNANNVFNKNNTKIDNLWHLKTKQNNSYNIIRCNNNNAPANDGTKLVITNYNDISTNNAIIINNFPFDNAKSDSVIGININDKMPDNQQNNQYNNLTFGSKEGNKTFGKFFNYDFIKQIDKTKSIISDKGQENLTISIIKPNLTKTFNNEEKSIEQIKIKDKILYNQETSFFDKKTNITHKKDLSGYIDFAQLSNGNIVACWQVFQWEQTEPKISIKNLTQISSTVNSTNNHQICYQILSSNLTELSPIYNLNFTNLPAIKDSKFSFGYLTINEKNLRIQRNPNILALKDNKFLINCGIIDNNNYYVGNYFSIIDDNGKLINQSKLDLIYDKTAVQQNEIKKAIFNNSNSTNITTSEPSIMDNSALFTKFDINTAYDGSNIIIRQDNDNVINFYSYDENLNQVKFSQIDNNLGTMPSIKINSNHIVDANNNIVNCVANGSNIINIVDDGIKVKINNFNQDNDIINFSEILKYSNISSRILQNSNSAIDKSIFYQKNDNNLIFTIPQYNIKLELANGKINEREIINAKFLSFGDNQKLPAIINASNVITKEFIVNNPNKNIEFNQLTPQIELSDLDIIANNNAKFDLEIKITDKNGDSIKNGLAIDSAITADEKYRLNFNKNNGTAFPVTNFSLIDLENKTGDRALIDNNNINQLLQNLSIAINEGFEPQDFKLHFNITNKENNQNYYNQVDCLYNCLEVDDKLFQKTIENQKSEVAKKIIIDFAKYLKNPQDKRLQGAVFKMVQAIKNNEIKLENQLEIGQINNTAFSMMGNKTGNYSIDFIIDSCSNSSSFAQNFILSLDEKTLENNNNNFFNTQNIALITAGVALLAIASVGIYKRKEIGAYLKSLIYREENNNKELANKDKETQNKEIQQEVQDENNKFIELVNRNHQEIIGKTNDNNKTINTEGNQISEGNHIDIEIPNSYMQPNNITEVNQNSKKNKTLI